MMQKIGVVGCSMGEYEKFVREQITPGLFVYAGKYGEHSLGRGYYAIVNLEHLSKPGKGLSMEERDMLKTRLYSGDFEEMFSIFEGLRSVR